MKAFKYIFIGIVIGGLLSSGAYWLYDSYREYKEAEAAAIQKKIEKRKAHRDSLMQIRNAEEEQERAENHKDIERRVVLRFLKEFYDDVIFEEDYPSDKYKHYLTKNCQKKLRDAYTYDCPDNNCLAWWIFRPSGQDVNLDELESHFRVTPEDDDWYRIHFVQDGRTEFRYVKVIVEDSSILIDDVK